MLSDGSVKSFSEGVRWKHMLTVTKVGEATRLTNQGVDNIAIIECNLLCPDQTWHLQELAALVPQRDMICVDTRLKLEIDQVAWNRICVLFDPDDARRRNEHIHFGESWELRWRQRFQSSSVTNQLIAAFCVALSGFLSNEDTQIIKRFKVATAS